MRKHHDNFTGGGGGVNLHINTTVSSIQGWLEGRKLFENIPPPLPITHVVENVPR